MQKTKVLILEDEAIVALDIKLALEKLDFEITQMVTNYDDALQSVRDNKPDILLADINLKNSINGIETAKAIQKIASIPIIYLTAFNDDITISKAAQTDPIGYISKPFKSNDLKSNILLAMHKRNSARKHQVSKECQSLGDGFYFNEKDKILYFEDQAIKLSKTEKKLLDILVRAQGQIVPMRTLENLIWMDTTMSDSTLRTLVYRLKTKLDYKLIETIPAVGCKINIKE